MSEFNENTNLQDDGLNEGNEQVNNDDISVSLTEKSGDSSKKVIFSNIVDYLEIFVIAICVVIAIFSIFFRTCRVDGDSMKNTLYNGENLIISNLFYTPERGDVIVFHQTGNRNMPLVKRVIALEGDTVTIDFNSWKVTVTDKDGNTTVLEEPYVNIDSPSHNLSGTHTYTVPENAVFVLGDNRNDSMDSTDSHNVGYVDSRRILGKVILRISPISKVGVIK